MGSCYLTLPSAVLCTHITVIKRICLVLLIMDIDRINMMNNMMIQDSHGSLLNRVYELQYIREKEIETMDLTQQMASLNFSSLPSNNFTPRSDICDVKLNKEDVMEEDMEQELDEKFSQARARSDPIYFLQQQQQQQQQQHLQQQQIVQAIQIQTDMHQYPSLVTHQQYLSSNQPNQ